MKSTFELKIFFSLMNMQLKCTSGKEISVKSEIRNICLAWLITDVIVEEKEISTFTFKIFSGLIHLICTLGEKKLTLKWEIFFGLFDHSCALGKRNYIYNEKYLSGLINPVCTLWEKKSTLKWEIFFWSD